MLTGAYTLLMTPFNADLALDEKGLRTLVRSQVASGIHGIAPLGVTGESPSMTEKEIARMVEIIVEEAGGKCRVAPDTCSCNLDQTVSRAKLYADLGCDYAVVFAPFLVKPNQDGLVDFYRKVADASPIPVIIHNAPERVGVNVDPKTYAKLMGHGNIAGAKDGNMQMGHLAKLLCLAHGTSFAVLTGKDTTCYPLMSFGGSGVFTVAGNVIPAVMRELVDLILGGEKDKALDLHLRHYELFEALRLETNPMAVKEALSLMGLPGGPLRPPLTRLGEKNREILKKHLEELRLI
jgi:4-hydroxy-tetrahydrodipicolinate synthase